MAKLRLLMTIQQINVVDTDDYVDVIANPTADTIREYEGSKMLDDPSNIDYIVQNPFTFTVVEADNSMVSDYRELIIEQNPGFAFDIDGQFLAGDGEFSVEEE